MNTTEALRALHSYGLPYEISNSLTAAGVLRVARTKGPVIVCEMYWSHPQWAGYTYMGRTLHGVANGVRVGFAMPTKHAGLTQWTFTDGHAILAAADDWSEGTHLGVIRDPNHNSPSRPERPAYDLVTLPQLNRMLNSFKSKYGYKVMLVPTRPIIRRAR